MHSGNKGEWSELYAFFFLAGKGRVYTADADLNKLGATSFLDIIRLIREEEKGSPISYYCGSDVRITDAANQPIKQVPAAKFSDAAQIIYEVIKLGNGKGSMEVADVEDFMEDVFVDKIKAPSSDKADLVMQIYDAVTSSRPETRWSIKSQMGNASTLLNASGATNFCYSISLTDEQMREINRIDSHSKALDRTQAVLRDSEWVTFDHVSNPVFDRNLMLIDLEFPRIMAEALLIAFGKNIRSCSEVVAELERTDPLNLGIDIDGVYEFKFKRFLTAVALGMTPSKKWDGQDDATGGYLIVTKDGDVVAFHVYNRNEFEDYLLAHTKFETPSMGRHGFGSVEKTEDGYEFSLNLQLRFDA